MAFRAPLLVLLIVVLAAAALVVALGRPAAAPRPASPADSAGVEEARPPGPELDRPSPAREAAARPAEPDQAPVAHAPRLAERDAGSWMVTGRLLDARTGGTVGVAVDVELLGAGGYRDGMTDDSGVRYELGAEREGEFVLRARARGYAPYQSRVDLRGVPGARAIDIRLVPSWLVLVRARTPDGEDLQLAIDRADLGDASTLAAVVTDVPVGWRLGERPPRNGAYHESRFDSTLAGIKAVTGAAIPADVLGVLEPFERWRCTVALTFGETVIAARTLEAEAAELTFVVGAAEVDVHLASVTVTVREARSGVPAAGQASLSPFPFPFLSKELLDGRRSFHRLSPGRWWAVIESPGLEQAVVPLDLDPGDRRRVDLELAPACQLTGRVVDEAGDGVLADVAVLRLDASPPVRVASGWTDEAGSFTFPALGPAPHAVVVVGDESSATNARVLDWVAPPTHVDLSPGDVPPVELVATHGAVLLLAREDDDPRLLDVRVHDDTGLLVRTDRIRPRDTVAMRLPPGTYDVFPARDSTGLGRFGVQVGGDEVRLVVAR